MRGACILYDELGKLREFLLSALCEMERGSFENVCPG